MKKFVLLLLFWLIAFRVEAQTIVIGATNPATTTPLFDPSQMVYVYDNFPICGSFPNQVGAIGWTSNAQATLSAIASASATQVGTCTISTGAVANNIGDMELGLISGGVDQFMLASASFDCVYIVELNQTDANTTFRLGVADAPYTNPPTNNGVYMEKLTSDTDWFFVTRAAASQTRVDSGLAADTNFHRWRVRRINSTTVGFTLDKGAEVTQTSTVPGATAVGPFFQAVTTAAAAKTYTVSFFSCLITNLGR